MFSIIGFRCHIGDEDYGYLAPCSEMYVISQASNPTAGQLAPVPAMAAALIGCIEPFDASANDCETYAARLEQYLDANSIREEKKAAKLLTLIGGPTYQLIRNLVAPADPKTRSFDELTAALTQHFAPVPLAIAEHYCFHKRDQAPGETVATYIAELTYRTYVTVTSVNEAVNKKLLEEKDIDLPKAIAIATATENASPDAAEMGKGSARAAPVHRITKQGPIPKTSS